MWDSDNMIYDLDNHIADADIKKIYDYYTDKSLKMFKYELIDKNEVFPIDSKDHWCEITEPSE